MVLSEAFLRTIGIGAFLTLAAGLSGIFVGALGRPRLIELQLARDPVRVKAIVQESGRVKQLRRQLLTDYAFIGFYWLTFAGLAVAIARRGGALYNILGLIAAFSATLTALLDIVENIRTRGMLALTRASDQVRRQPVDHLRRTSLAKWAASAVTVALLAILFLPGEGRVLLLGFAFVAVAALGAVATRWNKLIGIYFSAFFLLGGVLAVSLTVFPGGVLERL
jgi:hypothetical protein